MAFVAPLQIVVSLLMSIHELPVAARVLAFLEALQALQLAWAGVRHGVHHGLDSRKGDPKSAVTVL
ncbi:hypothetical protein KSC_051710 [Ktedonobacter sp. SOSP1-52]|nr:hypothetical protein KSC_051710 [Ktedonobacter sp. SOSP1-52]